MCFEGQMVGGEADPNKETRDKREKVMIATVLTIFAEVFSSFSKYFNIPFKVEGRPVPTLYTSPHLVGVWSSAAKIPPTVSFTKVKSLISGSGESNIGTGSPSMIRLANL